MGKMEGKVCTEASQTRPCKDRRSPSDECSRKEEIVSVDEGAVGREEKESGIGRGHACPVVALPVPELPKDVTNPTGC